MPLGHTLRLTGSPGLGLATAVPTEAQPGGSRPAGRRRRGEAGGRRGGRRGPREPPEGTA